MKPKDKKGNPPKAVPADKANRPTQTTPQTWPAFIYQTLCRPKLLAWVLALSLILYLVARSQGIDPWPPLLKYLGISTTKSGNIIAGNWKYRCTSITEPFYQHGGVCTIDEDPTIYGIEWSLVGHRQWKAEKQPDGSVKTVILDPPYQWKTSWGAVTSKDSVKFTYSINTGSELINGYCYGDILHKEGEPDQLVGMFYQFPPATPRFGRIEFRKQLNDKDNSW